MATLATEMLGDAGVEADPIAEELTDWERTPQRTHLLVWRHRSGRRVLVPGGTTSYLVGPDPKERRELLDGLPERASAAERVYCHEQGVADMVNRDNCRVLHRVCRYDTVSPRELHRTLLLADESIR
jgi:alpha-ketoglutarate-dependent taurine dioxygenase